MTMVEQTIADIRRQLLVGQKRGNRFLDGQSRWSIGLTRLVLSEMWNHLLVEGKKLKLSVSEPSDGLKTLTVYVHPPQPSAEKKLRKLHRKSQEALEERGFNFLTLCVGCVRWSDGTHSGAAPALLIPVQLNVSNRRASFSIEYTDEPVQWNPALVSKLRSEMEGETVPDGFNESVDNDDVEGLETAFLELKRLCAQIDWVVDEQMRLDVLDASQLQMYRDLELSRWGQLPSLIPKVLGRGFVVDKQLQALHRGDIDHLVQNPEKLSLILEADPTQSEAVAIAKVGGSLVIQGPPGTGKSQTIANAISTMIADGKKILFVAQKKAALDVVYQRLCNANLQHSILELHSSKSKRATVLKSLSDALSQGSVESTFPTDIVERVLARRATLEGVNDTLDTPILNTGMRIAEIFSHAYHSNPLDCAPTFHFPNVLNWDTATVETLKQTSVELSQLIASERLPWNENPFNLSTIQSVDTLSNDDFFRLANTCLVEVKVLLALLEQQKDVIGCSISPTSLGIEQLVRDLKFLAEKPSLLGINVALLKQEGRMDQAKDLLSQGQQLRYRQSRLLTIFEPTSLTQTDRIEQLLGGLRRLNDRWWKIFLPSWWRGLKVMKRYFLGEQGNDPEQWTQPVQELQTFHHQLIEFESDGVLGGRIFGNQWKGGRSDWTELFKILTWVEELPHWQERHPSLKVGNLMSDSTVQSHPVSLGTQIFEQWQTVQDALHDLISILKPTKDSILTAPFDLRAVQSLLESNDWTRQALARAIAINQVASALREEGLDEWVAWLMDGHTVSEVERQWEYSVGHSRVQRVLSQPKLHRVTRSTLHQHRRSFITEDAKLRFATQEMLVRRHSEDLQSLLFVGQMATLSAEMSKKRGHKSIRRLMTDCGVAIQRMKPVFMMSPISVATHLPQGMEFDVVIFDEASQMTTSYALGSLMRAKQAVVVGDSQQLSPTSFFSKKSDTDSILDRFVSNGCPSMMLSFHYRSRHPDLIAISNTFMYDGGLKPFPSPGTHPMARGVRFVSSKGSIYDRGNTRSNTGEAKLLVAEVARVIVDSTRRNLRPSIGLVAFSLSQKETLEDAWDALLASRSDIRQYCDALPEGEHVFVKNLEDVQGDERDIVFISVGYGYDGKGVFKHSFGPVGTQGGERRLNVLFSRARFEMVICANFEPQLISATKPAYAMLRAMLELSHANTESASSEPTGFVADVCAFIAECGYEALAQYGPAGNTIDIAVRSPESEVFQLAILCEGGTQNQRVSTRYKERLFPESLRRFGWPVYRVWSLPWYTNPEAERVALKQVLESAARPVVENKTFTLRRRERTTVQSLSWIQTKRLSRETLQPAIASDAQPQSHPKELSIVVQRLLKQEGPLSQDMIVKRVCTLMGVRRGKKNRTVILAVVEQLKGRAEVKSKHGFYWTRTTDLSPRIPGYEFRHFAELYPPHVLDFVRFYVEGSVEKSVHLTELAELLMELVGWEIKNQKRIDEFSQGLIATLSDTNLKVVEGVVAIRE